MRRSPRQDTCWGIHCCQLELHIIFAIDAVDVQDACKKNLAEEFEAASDVAKEAGSAEAAAPEAAAPQAAAPAAATPAAVEVASQGQPTKRVRQKTPLTALGTPSPSKKHRRGRSPGNSS